MNDTSPFVDCTDMIGNHDRLLDHGRQHGYFFFPGLIPTGPVLELRRQVLRVAEEHDLLEPGTDPNDGIRRNGVFIYEEDGTETFRRYYIDIQKLRLFHELHHHERIVSVLETLFDEPVFVHPRHILHIVFPGGDLATTPPHQDFHPVRGTRNTWTVWTPLGDCDAELGGLTIASGSNRWGFLKDDDVRSGKLFEDDTEWAWNPFKCGDVLMFHSLSIHRGRDNLTGNRIRLATSARYQPITEPVDGAALNVHMNWVKWEQVYTEWEKQDPLKYYWKSINLDVQPAYHLRKLANKKTAER